MRAKHVLLFDNQCPICCYQVPLLTFFDWFGAFEMVPLNMAEKVDGAGEIPLDSLMEALHCVTRHGNVHRGARAIRFVTMRLPLFIPLGLCLWIPGVMVVADKIYPWVSRNRHKLSRFFGNRTVCKIPSAPQHEPGKAKSK